MSFMYLAMTVDDKPVEMFAEPEEKPVEVPVPDNWEDPEEPTLVINVDLHTSLAELCKEEISGEFFVVELTPVPEIENSDPPAKRRLDPKR